MYDTFDTDEEFEYAPRLNKSQQKREIMALLELGKQLAQLDVERLHKLDLPPELLQALLDVQSMKHGAQKRQFKLICKMLRLVNTESLEQTISELHDKKEHLDRAFHQTEYWRDRLLTGDVDAMTELMRDYPHADASRIRQLVRNAGKELSGNRPPRSSRQLFRLLREMIEA